MEGHYFGGEGHNFFPLVWGRVTIFFKVFLGEGHNFFESIFIEKINYENHAAAGFRFFNTYFAPSVKEKMSRRQKQNDLYEFRRTILHLEGRSNR